MATIRYINTDEFKRLCDQQIVVVIDVRETDEYRYEHIPNTINMPLSTFSPNDAAQAARNSMLIIHCQSGIRTRNNQTLFAQIPVNDVLILEGGLNSWKQQRCVLVKNKKASLPIMRQVQIIVGSLILFGMVLSLTVSPWFLIIPTFLGGGLIFAGVTGFCGLATILDRLPYNQNNHCNNMCK